MTAPLTHPERLQPTGTPRRNPFAALAAFDRNVLPRQLDRRWRRFQEPRSLLVLDGWLDAKLVASFRHPVPTARSLMARNGFWLKKGLSLWLHCNRTLLDFCEKQSVALISSDGDPATCTAQLHRIFRYIALPCSAASDAFSEPQLPRNPTGTDVALPTTLLAAHDELVARVV